MLYTFFLIYFPLLLLTNILITKLSISREIIQLPETSLFLLSLSDRVNELYKMDDVIGLISYIVRLMILHFDSFASSFRLYGSSKIQPAFIQIKIQQKLEIKYFRQEHRHLKSGKIYDYLVIIKVQYLTCSNDL